MVCGSGRLLEAKVNDSPECVALGAAGERWAKRRRIGELMNVKRESIFPAFRIMER